MKNARQLLSFIAYCVEHPEERFWQALRNWSGYGFVLVANHRQSKGFTDTMYDNPRDTFSFERRRHDND